MTVLDVDSGVLGVAVGYAGAAFCVLASAAPTRRHAGEGKWSQHWRVPVVIGELIARTGGLAGRRVCAVVGSGDNGGDALWAAGRFVESEVAYDKALSVDPTDARALHGRGRSLAARRRGA